MPTTDERALSWKNADCCCCSRRMRCCAAQRPVGPIGPEVYWPSFRGASGDDVVPAHVLPVSWAADHRVVDGAALARFSLAWKALVEQPEAMLAHMR